MRAPNGRPRCSVFLAVSVDGYIAREDGSLDWLSVVQKEGEDYGYKAFSDLVDVLVIGRNTYDTVLDFEQWPYPNKRCVVMTHRPTEALHGEEFFSGAPAALLEKLGQEGVQRLYVDGGSVIQQFLSAQLIDDLTLSVIPLVLGAGIRLFDAAGPPQKLILEETHSWATGLVQLRYRLAPPPEG